MLDWFVQNKEVLKLSYAVILGLICFFIVLKTDKLFRLSQHRGIQYFRNAFFFYGIGFFVRYFFPLFIDNLFFQQYFFEFFFMIGSFSLLYSLVWKNFERYHSNYHTSLFNLNLIVFYLISIIVPILDYFWSFHKVLFIMQMVIFVFASALSFRNYFYSNRKNFSKYYFLIMFLSLVFWILNFFADDVFHWDSIALVILYAIDIVIFGFFFLLIVKATRK